MTFGFHVCKEPEEVQVIISAVTDWELIKVLDIFSFHQFCLVIKKSLFFVFSFFRNNNILFNYLFKSINYIVSNFIGCGSVVEQPTWVNESATFQSHYAYGVLEQDTYLNAPQALAYLVTAPLGWI